MNYREFVLRTRYSSYFKGEMLQVFPGNRRTLNNQLVNWQRQGKVHKLKRGLYTLNDEDRRAPLTPLMISNLIYAPSYVSLEYALSFFGLLPERVALVTAVTPHKTMTTKNFYGVFSYRSIKTGLFFGFQSIHEASDLPVLMAFPEKALLDKIYFDASFRPEEDYFLENLRLQNYGSLHLGKLESYGKRFDSRKIMQAVSILSDLIRREK